MYILVFYCLLNGLYNYFEKGSSNQINKISGALKFGIFKNLFSAFFACLMVIVSGCNFNYSIPLLGCALAFGFLIAIDLTNYLFLAKTGTIALISVVQQAASLILPTLAGIIFFNNSVKPIQWLFVSTLILASVMLCSFSKEIYDGFSAKSAIMLIIRFFACGLGSISMQVFAKIGDGNTNLFLMSAYIFASCFIFATLKIINIREQSKNEIFPKKLMIFGFISSGISCFLHAITVIASKSIDPLILFSFTSVGSILVNMSVGAIFYKEKPTPKSIAAIVIACASVVMINYYK